MILNDKINTGYSKYGRYSNVIPRVASFNGTDDYIDTGIDLSGATAFDLTIIYYRSTTGIDMGSMQGKGTSLRVGIDWFTDDKIYCYVCNGASGHSANVTNTGTGWFTLRMIYDGSGATDADKLKLYINEVAQTLTVDTSPLPSSLGVMDTQDFRIGQTYGFSEVYTTGSVSYMSLSKNGGTAYEYYPIGMGDYDYDVSGQNQHATWGGTGDRYAYNDGGDLGLITDGYSLWQKASNPDIHVPYNNAGNALSLTAGSNIETGYTKTRDIDGNSLYHNMADSLIDFDPDATTNSKLDIFDKSNATIHIATSSMDYYDAANPYRWKAEELRTYSAYNAYFETAYQDRLFTRVKDDLLRDIMNFPAKQTGSDLDKVKSYCGI